MTDHTTLDEQERVELLKMAGLSDDLIHQVEHATPTMVSDAVIQSDSDIEQTSDSDVVKHILAKAAGNQDKAMALVDIEVKAEFDRMKLSKLQAAARGVEASVHNKNAWAHCQKIRESMKAKVRAEFRTNGGFVKAKIAKTKALTPEQDAFLLANQDNPVLVQFLALQAGA